MRQYPCLIGPYRITGVLRLEPNARLFSGQYLDTNLGVAIRDVKVTGLKTDVGRARAVRELNILKSNPSNFTLRFYDVVEEAGHIYLCTERCNGTLKDHISRYGPLTGPDAKRLIAQLVAMLEFLHHDLKICHRDIRADHIVLDRYMNIRIAGFGVSQQLLALNQTFTSPFAALGETLAPEIVEQKPYTREVDVWAMGCVMFYLVTGRYPFIDIARQAMFAKIVLEEPTWPSDIDDDLIDLLKKMLTKNPGERIKSEDLKRHPYFADFDFSPLHSRSKDVDDARIDEFLRERGVGDPKDATVRAIARREIEIEDMRIVGSETVPKEIYRSIPRKKPSSVLPDQPMRIIAKSVVTGRSLITTQQPLRGLTDAASDTVFDGVPGRRYEQST